MSDNITLVGPNIFVLQVIKPSGAPIEDAKISVEWEELQNPYHETPKLSHFTTDAKGQAQIVILDPKDWWINPEGGTLAQLRVSKDFHGPIVPYGTDFKYDAATIDLRVRPKGDEQLVLRNVPQVTHTYWGRPRVLQQADASKPSILEVTLMEGGELGKEHPTIRTRRLSASHRQTVPPSTIPQIDEELLFHIAHGGLAPDVATDYKFKISPPANGASGPGTIELDLPAVTTTAGVPNVPRITARNSIVGGLRFMHLLAFTGTDQIVILRPAGMDRLNPRLMVGTIRLARRLIQADDRLKVVLTAGFNRGRDDSHGQGRAIDFSGVMAADLPGLVDPKFPQIDEPRDPNCIKKSAPDWQTVSFQGTNYTAFEKSCVAEVDFVVQYHWGMVKLLVDTPTGRIRRAENAAQYKNGFAPNSATEELVFRLADLPAVADRHPNHTLTDAHYERARDIFGAVYAFFAQEFAHRETYLGPTSAYTIAQDVIDQADVDDAGGAPTLPGPVQGNVIHPDYPAPDVITPDPLFPNDRSKDKVVPKRQTHINHVHANLGGVRPGNTDFER